MIEIIDMNISGANPDLANMFATAAKYDATCVLKSTLNEYAVVLTATGIFMGICFTLLFQYVRRKTAEKIEAAEYARKLKELADELKEENPDKPE